VEDSYVKEILFTEKPEKWREDSFLFLLSSIFRVGFYLVLLASL